MQSSIVHKLLTLLSVISQAQKPLTFSEIVEKTGLNKSTIHRLLSIAVEEGLVSYESQKKVYLLGGRVFDLVRNAYSGYDIQEVALTELIHLQRRTDADVTIAVLGGREVVHLRLLSSSHASGGLLRPGMREPLHCSASGKVFLAFLPHQILDARLEAHDFERFTQRTITSATDLRKELQIVRQAGYGRNDRETHEHVFGISAPVFNYLAEPIAFLNIWSSPARHEMKDLVAWREELKGSAQRVTELIGGLAPELPPLEDV